MGRQAGQVHRRDEAGETLFEVLPVREVRGADESPIVVDADGSTVHFVGHFTCLGSVLDQMLPDLPDVEARISKALAAFGALRHSLFGSRHISTATRARAFQVFCHANGAVWV